MSVRMWPFQRLVVPSVPRGGDSRGRRFMTGRDALAALRLILACDVATVFICSLHVEANGPLRILCAIPRVSDDPEADADRVESILNATVLPLAS